MSNDAIQELILAFLAARGGYVASASERELFLLVKSAVVAQQARDAAIDDNQ